VERRQLERGDTPLRGGTRVARSAALLGAGVPATLAAVDGGYFPERYGLAAVAFLLLLAVLLLLRDSVEWSRLDSALVGALVALTGWTALSAAWAPTASPPLQEAQRTLAYAAAALATLLIVRSGGLAPLAAGALGGITAVAAYALATRLAPGRLTEFAPADGYQLAEPIGYWNALGILVVLGILLASWFAACAPPPIWRSAAAATIPPLATTLAFTFSRGAWLGFAAGLTALVALAPGRTRLVARLSALAPAPALAVVVSLRLDGLTERHATLAQARDDGLVLLLVLGFTCAVAVVAVLAADALERRLDAPMWLPRAAGASLVTVAAIGVAAAVVAGGGPVDVVERGYDSFTAPLPGAAEPQLGARLASLSGNGRADYWRVAWDVVGDEPLLGAGAGTYERAWLQHRPVAFPARDAHNLYLEILAELGPVGLALLAAALVAPLVGLMAIRRLPGAAAVGAAYLAFLAHAAVDWDWEVPAVTATAIVLGAGLVASARSGRPLSRPRTIVRAAAVGAVAIALAAATAGQLGNAALATSEGALAEADGTAAASAARRARTLAPWSADPWRLLGEAQVLDGKTVGARRSLQHAARLDDEDWRVWYDLALLGEPSAAERARALNPLAPELDELTNPS
jgi:hypothetical protein